MRLTILTAVTAAVVVGLAVPMLWPAPAGRAPVMTLCRDGARSFSKHRSGTCSWHGGIAAFAGEAPRPMAEERRDAVVNDAAQAERRACQAMPSDEPWPSCAAR